MMSRKEIEARRRLKYPERLKIYYKENIDRAFERGLKKNYNLTVEQYEKILQEQAGCCDICNKEETRKGKQTKTRYRLAVDHCHKTRKVRGLLCNKCNTAIGLLGESEINFMNAIKYLHKHKNKDVA